MNPYIFQHEISIRNDGSKYFPVVAITNLDHAKMLHLAKGEIVGFPHEEEVEMNYIETTNILEMEETEQKAPRNWIPERSWKNYNKYLYGIVIYMAVRKLSFYIMDAEVTIKCDHLPLKKFLQKQTLNAKVNNWAVELEQFNLKLEWIQGIKNTLVDSLSRLLEVDPEAKLQPEKEGHEFGTFCFENFSEID